MNREKSHEINQLCGESNVKINGSINRNEIKYENKTMSKNHI